MARRNHFEHADCPVARALGAVGEWWSLLIVRDAFDGARRFSDFQQRLGVSKGILTTRLRRLVALDILELAPAGDGTAYQEYALTKKGRDLFPVVVGLRQWGEHHCFKPGEPRSVLVEVRTGQPVGRLNVQSSTGEVLTDAETMVKKVVRKRKT